MVTRGREPREYLILPVTILVCAVWALSAGIGALTGDFRFFEVASGPFAMMCGYVFGVRIIRGGAGAGGERGGDRERKESRDA